MDRGICNGCRSLSRISTVLVVVVVSLVLRSVSSIKLPEETCKPRPVVVSVTQDYRPYHITVYRCSGTCDANIPPSQKPCTAAKKKEIEVEFTGPLGQHHKTIKIYNHTSCSCECNLECNWAEGERLDGDNCRCLKGPSTDRFVGGQKNRGCASIQDWPSCFGIRYRIDSGSGCVHKTKAGSRECEKKLLQKRPTTSSSSGSSSLNITVLSHRMGSKNKLNIHFKKWHLPVLKCQSQVQDQL
ncbi:uncharacterized protein LOC110061760 isoform X1 [Orbicella faveolata]|uniref:uncharacterized protein LOC110061760 isoform X1 n=1 Tax=Orbicella faveolata TaxID=48498 RepID=UPI0009E615D8|nr:uncharacterized protein LOC110061760 isoform X1 [Orbicella faveolata]XP_020624265.1 uncharacterized protein LOC110061760 isoform X1 [Orbicella faveolata]